MFEDNSKKKIYGKAVQLLKTLARYSKSPTYGLLKCSSSAAESSAKRASYDSAPPYLLQPLILRLTYHPSSNPPPPHPVISYSAPVETGSGAYISVFYDAAKSSSQAFPQIHQSTLTRIAVVRQGVSS